MFGKVLAVSLLAASKPQYKEKFWILDGVMGFQTSRLIFDIDTHKRHDAWSRLLAQYLEFSENHRTNRSIDKRAYIRTDITDRNTTPNTEVCKINPMAPKIPPSFD